MWFGDGDACWVAATNELHLSKLLAGRRRLRRLPVWGSGRGVGPLVTVVHRTNQPGSTLQACLWGPRGWLLRRHARLVSLVTIRDGPWSLRTTPIPLKSLALRPRLPPILHNIRQGYIVFRSTSGPLTILKFGGISGSTERGGLGMLDAVSCTPPFHDPGRGREAV